MKKEIQGFRVCKTKWYVINILGEDNSMRRIDARCDTKEKAYQKADDFDRLDLLIYGKMGNRYIVKGEQLPIWFRD